MPPLPHIVVRSIHVISQCSHVLPLIVVAALLMLMSDACPVCLMLTHWASLCYAGIICPDPEYVNFTQLQHFKPAQLCFLLVQMRPPVPRRYVSCLLLALMCVQFTFSCIGASKSALSMTNIFVVAT